MILEKEKATSETLEAAEWLELLGQLEPDEIAQRLLEEGIRGVATSPSMCPIAAGLLRRGAIFPSVGLDVWTPDAAAGSSSFRALPDSVVTFIYRFDGGEYPSLEK